MAGNKNDGTVDDLSFEDFDFEGDLGGNGQGDDGVFELEDMPVAGKPAVDPPRSSRTVLAKPVEDEFEDDVLDQNTSSGGFGGGDFGGDDFEDDFPEVQDPAPVVPRRRPVSTAAQNSDNDAFGEEQDSFPDVDRHDDYEDNDDRGHSTSDDLGDNEVDEQGHVENTRSGSNLAKYGVYGAAGLALLILLGVGYTTVLPMFMGPSDLTPAPVVSSRIDDIPATTTPTLPGPILSTPNTPVLPGSDVPSLPGTGTPVLPGASESAAIPETTLQPVIEPTFPSLDDNVADAPIFDTGNQQAPTGLGTNPSSALAGNGDVAQRVERIESELDVLSRAELVEKVASLEQRLSALESRPASDTPAPMVSPPAKPQVIEDWALKGVQGGVAWIEGPTGFLEVRAGSDIPGVGKVEEVTTYENSWLVVTTAGVIMQN